MFLQVEFTYQTDLRKSFLTEVRVVLVMTAMSEKHFVLIKKYRLKNCSDGVAYVIWMQRSIKKAFDGFSPTLISPLQACYDN